MDILSNAVATSTGTVAKAVIKILDDRHLATDSIEKEEMVKESKEKSLLGDMGSDLVEAGLEKAAEAALTAAKSLKTAAGGIGSAIRSKLLGDGPALGKYDKMVEVQFNPTSLRITSHAGDEEVETMTVGQGGSQVGRGSADLHIELSVRLIFDQISNTGAFEQDMLTISSTRLVSELGGEISKDIFGSPQSVQVVTEAFIGMLRNPHTRRICFQWAEFEYEGVVRWVNVNYTMFDMNGNPIRAEVDLRMYLVDPDVDSSDSGGYWYDAYYAAFVQDNPAAMAMIKAAQAKSML